MATPPRSRVSPRGWMILNGRFWIGNRMPVRRSDPGAKLRRMRGVHHCLIFPRIEMRLQRVAVVAVALLQFRRIGGIGRHALRKPRLEHEGHRIFEFVRLQLRVARALERVAIRPMRQHRIVQAHAARREAFGLGVVQAVDQPHELAHAVHVIPGRPERIFRHHPAFGEADESMFAVPGVSDGDVMTVKIDGSAWSNKSGPTGEKRRKSYL